jgi:hypothetical protein
MAKLKHHSNFSLRDDAAEALNRAEDERGVIRINSALRTEGEQQQLINRWDRGGRFNRPPYLFSPARPASTSNHVRNGGIAIDTPDYERFNNYCEDYGYRQVAPYSDAVHFEFFGLVIVAGGAKALGFSQTVQNEQNWLIQKRGETNLIADGLKGAKTRDAYKRYQEFLRAHGYTGLIDGVWGPATQTAHAWFFQASMKPVSTVVIAGALADVQRALKSKYPLYAGKLAVDGINGPATIAAVKEFQRRSRLTVDGIAGPQTRRALGI